MEYCVHNIEKSCFLKRLLSARKKHREETQINKEKTPLPTTRPDSETIKFSIH